MKMIKYGTFLNSLEGKYFEGALHQSDFSFFIDIAATEMHYKRFLQVSKLTRGSMLQGYILFYQLVQGSHSM